MDDARAALYLYLQHRRDWERWVAQGGRQQQHPVAQAAAAAAQAGGKLGLVEGAGGAAQGRLVSLEELAKQAEHLADL